MSLFDTPHAKRPAFAKDYHLHYLDALRESGATNMFGAASFLMRDYRMSRDRAVAVLAFWMQTFAATSSAREAERNSKNVRRGTRKQG